MRDPFYNLAVNTMQSVYSRSPRDYQQSIIPHILRMMANVIPCEPVLLVQSTGSGKSSVPLTCAVVEGGVSFIIENTLSLGSDQTSKVNLTSSQQSKIIKSYQLDMFKSIEHQEQLAKAIINHCKNNNNSSIILFTSPETLLKATWIKFLCDIIDLDLLRLFCIDEAHLFIDFGLSFRSSFQQLKAKVIKPLKNANGSYKVPIIIMTATFNIELINLIQKMLGIHIKSSNTSWGNPESFRKRHIKIICKYSNHYFKYVCNDIDFAARRNISEKNIIICSTAQKVKLIQDKLDSFLDANETIKGDSVIVVGNQETELKYSYTTAFTNTVFPNEEAYLKTKLSPRFLIGTPGCIGAGLDCDYVQLVTRIGIPSGIIDFIQEMGRCGRQPAHRDEFNSFTLVFTLNDYVYLMERMFVIDSSDENNEERVMSVEEERKLSARCLNNLCQIMFLEYGCWHLCFELHSSNPFVRHPNYNLESCGSNCPHCNGTIRALVKTISRKGIEKFLSNVFIENSNGAITPVQLAKKMYEFPSAGRIIYCRQTALKPEKAMDTSLTVLQLLCSNLLCLKIEECEEPKAIVTLALTDSRPNYFNDSYWTYIRHHP